MFSRTLPPAPRDRESNRERASLEFPLDRGPPSALLAPKQLTHSAQAERPNEFKYPGDINTIQKASERALDPPTAPVPTGAHISAAEQQHAQVAQQHGQLFSGTREDARSRAFKFYRAHRQVCLL